MKDGFKFLIYQSVSENVSVNAVIKDESVWLTQKAMAELFEVEVPAISKHLANIFEEGELRVDSTVSKMEIVQQEGSRSVRRTVDFYNLDAIISVGYRVNSRRATHFRIWATGVLKEYMTNHSRQRASHLAASYRHIMAAFQNNWLPQKQKRNMPNLTRRKKSPRILTAK